MKWLKKEAWVFVYLFIPWPSYAVSYDSGSFSTDNVTLSTITANNVSASTVTANQITANNRVTTASMTVNNTAIISSGTFGLVTISSGMFQSLTMTGLFTPQRNAAPRTNVTPLFAGQLIYNTTQNEYCISTGTIASSWANIASTTTACKS